MRSFLTVCLLAAGLNSSVFASNHWDFNQVRHYVHHSEIQRRANWKVISKHKFNGDESILDIGCGDGRLTSVISDLIPRGKILGIDPNESMISWAKRQYTQEEYPNLSFKIGDYLVNDFSEHYDLITSFFSYHLLPSEVRNVAIEKIYTSLKPGGKLIMLVPPEPSRNSAWSISIRDILQSDEWKNYFNNFAPSFVWEDLDDLRTRFSKSSFQIDILEFRDSQSPFVDKAEFAGWIMGTMDFVQKIPVEMREKFSYQLIDSYLKYRPDAVQNGSYLGHWGYYVVEARKPDIKN